MSAPKKSWVWPVRITLALAVAEASFRMLGLPNLAPSEVRKHSLPYGRSIFNSQYLRPGAPGRTFSAEFFGPVTYPLNSQGFRGPETAEEKAPGTIRIAAVGASGLFDLTASGFDDWPSQLGRELSRRLGRNVEVLNFGDPGALTIDLALRVSTDLYRFKPDYVLLCDSWMELKYLHLRKTYFQIPPEEEHNLFVSYSGRTDKLLSESSRVYAFARDQYLKHVHYSSDVGDHQGNIWVRKFPLEDGFPAEQLNAPTGIGLHQYEQSVRLFVDATREIGAKPLLMSEPTLISLDLDQAALAPINHAFYEHFTEVGLVKSLASVHDTLLKVAAEKRVFALDFDAEMSGRPEFYFDHVHLTPEGRGRIVSLAADRLTSLLGDGSGGAGLASAESGSRSVADAGSSSKPRRLRRRKTVRKAP